MLQPIKGTKKKKDKNTNNQRQDTTAQLQKSINKQGIKAITKTRLFKYIENFTTKHWKFSDKNSDIFLISAQKHRLWVLVRTGSVLTSTDNLCF